MRIGSPLLAARGKSLASHRDRRGALPARRDDREYREYLSEEQRSRRGCIARRMQPDFHHGLLSHTMFPIYVAALLWVGLWLRDYRVRALLRECA
jgi:hypothetical protein